MSQKLLTAALDCCKQFGRSPVTHTWLSLRETAFFNIFVFFHPSPSLSSSLRLPPLPTFSPLFASAGAARSYATAPAAAAMNFCQEWSEQQRRQQQQAQQSSHTRSALADCRRYCRATASLPHERLSGTLPLWTSLHCASLCDCECSGLSRCCCHCLKGMCC